MGNVVAGPIATGTICRPCRAACDTCHTTEWSGIQTTKAEHLAGSLLTWERKGYTLLAFKRSRENCGNVVDFLNLHEFIILKMARKEEVAFVKIGFTSEGFYFEGPHPSEHNFEPITTQACGGLPFVMAVTVVSEATGASSDEVFAATTAASLPERGRQICKMWEHFTPASGTLGDLHDAVSDWKDEVFSVERWNCNHVAEAISKKLVEQRNDRFLFGRTTSSPNVRTMEVCATSNVRTGNDCCSNSSSSTRSWSPSPR